MDVIVYEVSAAGTGRLIGREPLGVVTLAGPVAQWAAKRGIEFAAYLPRTVSAQGNLRLGSVYELRGGDDDEAELVLRRLVGDPTELNPEGVTLAVHRGVRRESVPGGNGNPVTRLALSYAPNGQPYAPALVFRSVRAEYGPLAGLHQKQFCRAIAEAMQPVVEARVAAEAQAAQEQSDAFATAVTTVFTSRRGPKGLTWLRLTCSSARTIISCGLAT